MSFVRPELARAARRWAETAIYASLTAVAVLWSLVAGPMGWLGWAAASGAAAIGALLIRSAALSALSDREGAAPGVVKIDERRIAYFGPHEGGVVALDELASIDILAPDPSCWRYEVEWALRGADPAAVIVPASSVGAEGMIDAFAALPGFAPARAVAALARAGTKAGEGTMVTIWRRDPGPAAPTLAPSTVGR
ncbi:MAG: hypothetical protein AAGF90_07890 [Pseudomonadota bacterium]